MKELAVTAPYAFFKNYGRMNVAEAYLVVV
jgi:hypothetical protein